MDKTKKINWHFFFLFIFSLNYFLPLILFKDFTLFISDALDSEIVYNHVIGKILSGDKNSVQVFLNGEIAPEFLRRLYQPYSYLYSILGTKGAYWTIDCLVKIVSYVSFFVLAKKINKDIFIACLLSALFASINTPTLNGFGLAILPYVAYLCLFKSRLKFKHYLIVIIAGLNSDLVIFGLSVPIVAILIILLKKDKKFLKNYFIIFFLFFASIIISNLNMITIYDQTIFHRSDRIRPYENYNIIFWFLSLLKLNLSWSWVFFKGLPLAIIVAPIYIFSIFAKSNETKIILIFIIVVQVILFFLSSNFVIDYRNNNPGLIKDLSIEYIDSSFLFILTLLASYTLREVFLKNVLIAIIFLAILIGQINSSIIPFAKKYLGENENYRNVYTFNGYYMKSDYQKIKKIVKNKRTISLGMDPMVAVMNDIYVIDGYHNLYPLKYKRQFRPVIKKELEKSKYYEDYYDNWGSRVYAFIIDPNNIEIDFNKAKDIGALFVISRYKLDKDNLKLISNDFENEIHLYQIL